VGTDGLAGLKEGLCEQFGVEEVLVGFAACSPKRSRLGNFLLVIVSVTFRPNRKSSGARMVMPSRCCWLEKLKYAASTQTVLKTWAYPSRQSRLNRVSESFPRYS
jgi:hypothetical protein